MNLAALLPHIDPAAVSAADADFCDQKLAAMALAQQEAEDAIRAELAAQCEASCAELTATHQHSMQTARQEWCEGEAAALAASLAQQVDAASSALANCVHRIILPFATAATTKAALQDLCSKVQQAAAADLKAEIRLEGPDDLVQAMQAALATAGFEAAVVGSHSTDLQARIGETRLLSHLPEWLAALKDSDHG